MTNDSNIHISKGGISYNGPDAVNLLRASMLWASIKLHMQCGMIPTRGVTITKMFKMAGEYTGKTYKRGQHQAAIDDLNAVIDAKRNAIPVTVE